MICSIMSHNTTLNPVHSSRGDPRMNLAVELKLKNPQMTLFDALEKGGFKYQRNVDAATMDNDRVTLGQRKNQLNRRLRLARKHLKEAEERKSKEGKVSSTSESSKRDSSAGGKTLGSEMSPLVIAGSYLRRKPKRSSNTKVEQPNAKKARTTTSALRANISSQIESTSNTPAAKLKQASVAEAAVAAPGPAQLNNYIPTDDDTALAILMTSVSATAGQQTESGLNWWPTNMPTVLDSRSTGTDILVGADTAVQTPNEVPGASYLQNELLKEQQQQQQYGVFAGSESSFGSAVVTSSNDSSSHRSHDGNDACWIHNQERQIQGDEQQRSEFALQYFQARLQNLYKESMTAAGFGPDQVTETSKEYHLFAFQAWKQECERLQTILEGKQP